MTHRLNQALILSLVLALGGTSLALAKPYGSRDMDRTEMREEMFNRFDTDGDGQVTRADIEAAGDTRFQDADTDGDGFLSTEEMQAAARERASERAEKMAGRMLERLDADGDGRLSQEELDARRGDRSERVFERADTDGDGVITRAEFMAAEMPWGRRGGDDRP